VELQRAGIICSNSCMPPKFIDLDPDYSRLQITWESTVPNSMHSPGGAEAADQLQKTGQNLIHVSRACEVGTMPLPSHYPADLL